MGVLEIAKPAAQHRIELGDDACKASASRASRGFAYPILEAIQAFLADPSLARFEAVAKKIKTLAFVQAVASLRLVWMKRETLCSSPFRYRIARLVGGDLALTQHDEVVGIAHHAVSLIGHELIQIV